MAPQVITRPGAVSAPEDIALGALDQLTPESAFAHYDGSGASGAFLPALTYYTQDGRVFARALGQQVAAGASADVSYFPGLSAAAATTPAIALLYSNVLTGSAASFDITPIDQSYSHLWFVMKLRCDGVTAVTNALIEILGDTGANYETVQVNYDSGSADKASGQAAGGLTALRGGLATGSTADANHFGIGMALIPTYYVATGDHPWLSHDGAVPVAGSPAGWQARSMYSQHCGTSGAVTRVTILPGSGSNFVAGSAVSMYGLL